MHPKQQNKTHLLSSELNQLTRSFFSFVASAFQHSSSENCSCCKTNCSDLIFAQSSQSNRLKIMPHLISSTLSGATDLQIFV